MMNEPTGFAALPVEQQERIRQSGNAIVHLAQQHAGGLIIAPPPSRDGFFATGSYFILELEGRYWLATANHVVESFERATADDPAVKIQIGELMLGLTGREVIRDDIADVCLVSISSVEYPVARVPALSAAAGWPPPGPREGDYVAISGYPASIRERPTRRRVEFNALSAIYRVTQAGKHHCSCQFEREEWINFEGPPPPDPGTDLGGMSGGPVLMIGGLGFPVIGAISQFESSFEILRIGLFQRPVFGG
jgi:hypothetical protein